MRTFVKLIFCSHGVKGSTSIDNEDQPMCYKCIHVRTRQTFFIQASTFVAASDPDRDKFQLGIADSYIFAGRPVSDKEIQRAVGRHLVEFAAASSSDKASKSLALVETAGGPGSPGPSGRLQVLPFYTPPPLPLTHPYTRTHVCTHSLPSSRACL